MESYQELWNKFLIQLRSAHYLISNYIQNHTYSSIVLFEMKCAHKEIFYILYFIFYILYFIFYILYFIFYILYVIFYILYFIFYILYFIFYILYFIFYILYFIFYILYFILYIRGKKTRSISLSV